MNNRKINGFILWQKWKDVPDFEGIYRCGTLGILKSLASKKQNNNKYYETVIRKERILGKVTDKTRYIKCTLYNNGVGVNSYIHVIVAKTFLGYIRDERKLVVNHKDENKLNNRVSNLEICTQSFNVKSRFESGRVIHNKGIKEKKEPKAKLKKFKIIYQYDLENNLIAEYSGSGDASRKTGIHSASIRNVIQGKHNVLHGFKFTRTKILKIKKVLLKL